MFGRHWGYFDAFPSQFWRVFASRYIYIYIYIIFWNAHGITYTDYFEKGQLITGAYYASLLYRLSEEIKKKRPHLKKILFHQDNKRVHKCAVLMPKIIELKFELLQHPPYSLDRLDLTRVTFFISKLEKMARRTTVYVERECRRPNRCLFWWPSEILLFGRLKKVRETLGKVYKVKRRLYWKIKKIYTK